MRRKSKSYEETHKIINGVEYKLCSDCNDWHPMTEEYFYKNKCAPDGFNPYCKESTIKRSRKHQDSHKEDHSKSQMKYAKTQKGKQVVLKESRKWREKGGQKEYYSNNKERFIAYRIRNQVERKHEITDEEWHYCLDYFNNSCAYCGLSYDDQIKLYNERLHMEHVYHDSNNYIDNCIPACTKCNTSKHDSDFNDWYNEDNEVFSKRRYNKIVNWMTKECFKVLNLI